MPLESTIMILDNSEYMRNGDYQPTRFEAQSDAVNVIFQTKTDSNPESTIGVMTMAGKGPEVLVTNTKDIGSVLQGLHTAAQKLGGTIDLPTAINIAQLALKHRENKNLRQRILVFVGSPLEGQAADKAFMVKLAKKLKKNNVAVDVVAFGDGIEEPGMGEDGEVLKAFVETVNSSDNSHIVSVPPGTALLSECIMSSAVLAADRGALIPEELREGADAGAGGASAGAGGSNDFEFGIDPSLDPELAMALRLSMQEAQAREAAENAASSSSGGAAAPAAESSSSTTTAASAAAASGEEEFGDMDPELLRALAMSQERPAGDHDVEMEDDDEEDEDLDGEGDDDAIIEDDGLEEQDEDEDEDAAIQRAIEMSMQTQEKEEEERKKAP